MTGEEIITEGPSDQRYTAPVVDPLYAFPGGKGGDGAECDVIILSSDTVDQQSGKWIEADPDALVDVEAWR